jgi:hypothetical protein
MHLCHSSYSPHLVADIRFVLFGLHRAAQGHLSASDINVNAFSVGRETVVGIELLPDTLD